MFYSFRRAKTYSGKFRDLPGVTALLGPAYACDTHNTTSPGLLWSELHHITPSCKFTENSLWFCLILIAFYCLLTISVSPPDYSFFMVTQDQGFVAFSHPPQCPACVTPA